MTGTPLSNQAWDNYDAYLFDIDGTLLNCRDAVHYFGFCKVLSEIAGRSLNLDGVVTHGNTDIGILRDAFSLAEIPEATWRPRLAEIRNSLCTFVEEHASELYIDLLPAVKPTLAYLRARGVVLGVATGNLKRIGWAKLAAANLEGAFDFGSFSDLSETRAQTFKAAAAQARVFAANPLASICVVGDTPTDVYAARENSLDVIAVATGTYTFEQLQASHPTLVVHSLEEFLKA